MTTENKKTGAENVRWDLSFLYSGVDDPQIDRDVAEWVAMAKKFHATHKGNLQHTLGHSLTDQAEMSKLGNKIRYYLFFRTTLNTNDGPVKAKKTEIERTMSMVSGECLEFFTLEIAALDQGTLASLYERDPVVTRHRSLIEKVRIFRPHQLTEEVESALTKRSEFGSTSWAEFFDEIESDLRFVLSGEEKKLEEILHVLSVSKDAEERTAAMKIVNDGLGGYFAKYAAQTLNIVIGEKAVEDRERGYKHPMEQRNKGSLIPDAVVEALHAAMNTDGSRYAQEYYRLKGKHLGIEKLRWSDRNAPLPFADTSVVSWDDALKIVIDAYESFSPTLAGFIRQFVEKKWIDAPVNPQKAGGAYSASGYIPAGPIALTMLNYLGSSRDVMVVAHEFGHSVHGMLAGEAQGSLMMRPPMAYAETASVFGEMTTFNYLKKRLAQNGDQKQMLALIMGKLDDILNTTVRQIAFSNLERRFHGHDGATMTRLETKKYTVEDFDGMFLETQNAMYGNVFTYENAEHLWAYVGHFHNPFYVYAYAFGELLTHSLYAKRAEFGERFEPLYLDLLRSGGTKDVVELLKPFGLDPTDSKFWQAGIEASIGSLLKEAEDLSAQIGINV